MRIKIFLKKLISISVAAVLAGTLIGCFDLGDFSDEEAYYDSFGDIRLVYPTAEKEAKYADYSVSTYFYNENTGKNFQYGNEETGEVNPIPKLSYIYMSIPVEQDMNIESLALYFNADKEVSMEVFVYLVEESELPDGGGFTNIRLLGDPEYLQERDENDNLLFDTAGNPVYKQKVDENGKPMTEGGSPIYETAMYSDPSDDLIVAKTSVAMQKEKWVSLMVQWNGENALQVEDGQYLLLRFINNSGLNTNSETAVTFNTTNLLIRALF
jgi:hypothetical protein